MVSLKENHQHYYQIQMQMAVSNRKWCDYVMFTNTLEDVTVVRVKFNAAFWGQLKEKLLRFHRDHIVPALVAQGF